MTAPAGPSWSASPSDPLAVVEIAERLPVSRPAVSQHLKVLKDAGLVSEDAVGRRRIYRLNPAGVSALRDQLDTFWNRALAGYEATLDQPRRRQHDIRPRHHGQQGDRRERADRPRRSACSPNGSATSSQRSTTCSASPIAETVFERKVGGHIFDRGRGRLRVPLGPCARLRTADRVVFSWDIGPTWQLETDPDNTSEVEVRFIAEAADAHPHRARAPQPRPPRPRLGRRPCCRCRLLRR